MRQNDRLRFQKKNLIGQRFEFNSLESSCWLGILCYETSFGNILKITIRRLLFYHEKYEGFNEAVSDVNTLLDSCTYPG